MPGPKEMDPAFKKFLEDTNRRAEVTERAAQSATKSLETARIAESAVASATGATPILPPPPNRNTPGAGQPTPPGNAGGGAGTRNPAIQPGGNSRKIWGLITIILLSVFFGWAHYHSKRSDERKNSEEIAYKMTQAGQSEIEKRGEVAKIQAETDRLRAETDLEKTRGGPTTILIPDVFSGGDKNLPKENVPAKPAPGEIEITFAGNDSSILSRVESGGNRFAVGKASHQGVCVSDQEFFTKAFYMPNVKITRMEISRDCEGWLKKYEITGPYRIFTEKGRPINLVFQ